MKLSIIITVKFCLVNLSYCLKAEIFSQRTFMSNTMRTGRQIF